MALVNTNITLTLTATNNGPLDADSVVTDALLPAGLQYVSHTGDIGGYNANTGKWTVPALAVGAQAKLYLTVQIQPHGPYRLTASVRATQGESDPSNNVFNFDAPVDFESKYLAIGCDVSPYLIVTSTMNWAPIVGTPTLPGIVRDVSWSPDGSMLAVAHDSGDLLSVFDTATWEKINGIPLPTMGQTSGMAVSFSQDGTRLAFGFNAEPYVQTYAVGSWAMLGFPAIAPIYGGGGNLRSVKYADNGNYLVVCAYAVTGIQGYNRDLIAVYDSSTWLKYWNEEGNGIYGLARKSSGGEVFYTRKTTFSCYPMSFELTSQTLRSLGEYGNYGFNSDVAMTNDGSKIAIGILAGTYTVVDEATLSPLTISGTNYTVCDCSPDDRFIAFAGDYLRIHDQETLELVSATYNIPGAATCCEFRPVAED